MNKIFILGLCILCLFIYLNSLNNGFVLDDEPLIVNNPFIKSPKFLPIIFKSSLFDSPYDKMYRPLQLLTYSIDYKIWGLKPAGFHLTNIIFHMLNGILVYSLSYMIFSSKIISMGASILFLVHPIHVSSVSYISGRADLLVCFFMFLSMVLFVKFIKENKNFFYTISLLSGILAIFSRENSLLLFIFIALIIFILNKRPQYYLYIIPFILLDFCYFLLRFFIFGRNAISLHSNLMSLFLRIINFFNIAFKYLTILFLPLDLHMLRTTPFITSIFDIRLIFAAGFMLLIIFLFIKFRTNKLLLFSLIWFFVGLLPVFLFFDGYIGLNKAVMAESWVYLSSVGFFISFAFLCIIFKKTGGILFLFFVVFYIFLTVINNQYFKNNIILYENILSYNGGANPLRKGLIKAYFEKGLYEEAFGQIKELGVYYPQSHDFYFYSGLYYFLVGNIDKAIENYNFALSKGSDHYVYYNLSLCYEKLKNLDKAIDFALECYKINPFYLPGLIKLGDLYMQKEEVTESRKYYEKALELDPQNKIIMDKILKLKMG